MTATHQTTSMTDTQIVGFFEKPGEYIKDFFFLKDGDTYHLIYGRGVAAPKQSWMLPGNEDTFSYATSRDLWQWEHHEPAGQSH